MVSAAEERDAGMVQPDDHRVQRIAGQLAVTLRAVRTALGRATAVLLGREADDGMKATEQALHELRVEIEDLVPGVPGRSADLRATVAAVHLGGDLERLSQLTQQIAEIAWARQSRQPLPQPVMDAVARMSDGVLALVERAGRTAALGPAAAVDATAALERELGSVAGQQRVLDELLVSADPAAETADAVDLALLGRCYESCARHAVSAASHVAVLSS